jgi:hypothetical protein
MVGESKMSSPNTPPIIIDAYREFTSLLEHLDKVRSMFQRAGATMPDLPHALLGGNAAANRIQNSPFRPEAPENAEKDWIWVSVQEANPTTLSLAIAKASAEPLTARQIYERIVQLGGTVSEGSVGNIGTRYANNLISRDEVGRWVISEPEKIATLFGDFVCGSASVLQSGDLAAFRRRAVLHLLRATSGGLMQAQIVAQLRDATWMPRDPLLKINKDLMKGDMDELFQANKARRMTGNSKKWEAI